MRRAVGKRDGRPLVNNNWTLCLVCCEGGCNG